MKIQHCNQESAMFSKCHQRTMVARSGGLVYTKKRATLEAAWTCPKNEINKWLGNDGDHFKCGLSRRRAGSKRSWQDANFTDKMMGQPNVWSILEGETKACWCAQVGCWHTKEKNTPSCSALKGPDLSLSTNRSSLYLSIWLVRLYQSNHLHLSQCWRCWNAQGTWCSHSSIRPIDILAKGQCSQSSSLA